MPEPRWTHDQILEHTQLPGWSKIYILGCMERRRVTMGSQQIRAINLVHALATQHYQNWRQGPGRNEGSYPGWHESVLVVGGSAGGLTAAAHAAFRGAKVTVVEKEAEWMANIAGSKRLLHPRIYEWGSPQPFEANQTAEYWKGGHVGIPLLDWTAGEATRVRDELCREWTGWEKLYRIKTHRRRKVTPRADDKWGLLACLGRFDQIILAVGFGQERTVARPEWVDDAAESYWRDDTLADRNGDILICGGGDGALTDLFRACLRDFGQDQLATVLERIDPDRALERRVLKIETALERHRGDNEVAYEMARAYLCMHAPALDAWTKKNLRKHVRVWLSVRPTHGPINESAFNPGAFPLNRLLLASLLRVAQHTVHVIFTKGDLPLIQPGAGKHYLVYRVGLAVKPVQEVLPYAADKLTKLEDINRDISTGDITRQPIWPFFGEAIDPHALPGPGAFVPSPKDSPDRVATECFRNVSKFEVISEAFDSVFQAAAGHAFSDADAKSYFKGVMRFYMLAFDRILLTDAQVWDGKVMLRLPDIWPTLDPKERRLIKKKFMLRERSRGSLKQARDAIYLRKGNGAGEFRGREFVWSMFSDDFSKAYADFCKTDDAILKKSPSVETLLRRFKEKHEQYSDGIEQLIHAWANFDRTCKAIFQRSEWPDPRRTRFWNATQQLENPGRFHADLSPRAQAILEHAYKKFVEKPDRSHVHAFLRKAKNKIGEGEDIQHEIAQISDWFDRAYNRMSVKNQGANVFSALLLGKMPGAIEGGTRLKTGRISIFKLGSIESSGFVELERKWRETTAKKAKDIIEKPVTEYFWRKLFDVLGKTLEGHKGGDELKIRPGHGNERVAKKMAKYSSIDAFRMGWVGDLEFGQPGESPARSMTTEGKAGGRDLSEESQTETFRQNPLD